MGSTVLVTGATGFIAHVASSVSHKPPCSCDGAVRPAVDGTLRVLKSRSRAGVQRVMMMSGASHRGSAGTLDALASMHRTQRLYLDRKGGSPCPD